MITKESIMNFEVEQTVSYGPRLGTVIRIAGNKIRVQFEESGLCDWIDYSFLRILPTIKKINPHKYIKWTELEKNTLINNAHLTNRELSKMIDRSEDSINQARFRFKTPKGTMRRVALFNRAQR